MPGKTEEVGTVKATLRLDDYSKKYPDMHTVIASKSTKVDAVSDQVSDYEFKGYKVLEQTSHGDLVVMGKPLGSEYGDPQTDYLAQRREELEMANTFNVGREEMAPQSLGKLAGKE